MDTKASQGYFSEQAKIVIGPGLRMKYNNTQGVPGLITLSNPEL